MKSRTTLHPSPTLTTTLSYRPINSRLSFSFLFWVILRQASPKSTIIILRPKIYSKSTEFLTLALSLYLSYPATLFHMNGHSLDQPISEERNGKKMLISFAVVNNKKIKLLHFLVLFAISFAAKNRIPRYSLISHCIIPMPHYDAVKP